MAKVNLKRPFFAPDGTQYFPHSNPHDFPDDWELPSTAQVVDEKPAKVSSSAERTELEKKTVPELQKLLRDKKIDFESDANKASLIDKLLT